MEHPCLKEKEMDSIKLSLEKNNDKTDFVEKEVNKSLIHIKIMKNDIHEIKWGIKDIHKTMNKFIETNNMRHEEHKKLLIQHALESEKRLEAEREKSDKRYSPRSVYKILIFIWTWMGGVIIASIMKLILN